MAGRLLPPNPDWRVVFFALRRERSVAACLIVGVTVASWRMAGRRTAAENIAGADARRRIAALQSAKTSDDALLFAQGQIIARLQTESQAGISDLEKLHNQLRTLQERQRSEDSVAQAGQERLIAERAAADEQLHNLSRERDRLLDQLREVSETTQNVQSELARARSERDLATGRAGLLETQIKELAAAVQDQQHRLTKAKSTSRLTRISAS